MGEALCELQWDLAPRQNNMNLKAECDVLGEDALSCSRIAKIHDALRFPVIGHFMPS